MTVTYAKSVVRVLRDHFSGLTDPLVEDIITKLVAQQAGNPRGSFEVIVDNPAVANWRLRPDRQDPRRVKLTCFRQLKVRDMDVQLEQAVNDALAVL